MEAFLFGSQEKIPSVAENVEAAIVPVLKLITMILFGFILVKYQITPKPTLKILSKLVFVLFLPCIIFTYLGPSITLKKMVEWWFIPVNVIINNIIGCILGYLVALICRPPEEFFRLTIIMTGFGNTGNLQLAIVTSVCATADNPFGTECYGNGVAYVSFVQWIAVILMCTFVYHMMEPPVEEEYNCEIDDDRGEIEEAEEEAIGDQSVPLLVEAELIGLGTEDEEANRHNKSPFIARLFKSISGSSSSENNPESIRCLAEPRMVKNIRLVAEKTPIHYIVQPPTIATVLAIIIGVIPKVKAIVYGTDAPLEFLTDSLEILSEAMVPSVMLVLGGILAEGPKHSNLGIRTTIGIIIARLLVLPGIGIGVVYLADKWNLLISGDLMYRFVLFLQYTTPSAILIGALANLRGYAVKESSALLFWQHLCAVLSLSLYMILYFNLPVLYV